MILYITIILLAVIIFLLAAIAVLFDEIEKHGRF